MANQVFPTGSAFSHLAYSATLRLFAVDPDRPQATSGWITPADLVQASTQAVQGLVNGEASVRATAVAGIQAGLTAALATVGSYQVSLANESQARANADTALAAAIAALRTGGGGSAATLAGLLDVLLNNPATGDVLAYDATAGKWRNTPAASVGAGGSGSSQVLIDPGEGVLLPANTAQGVVSGNGNATLSTAAAGYATASSRLARSTGRRS